MGELYYEFECGCRVKQLGTEIKTEDNLPPLKIDFYNLRDCPRVWEDMKTGFTKGVFQLESQLGQSWCKKVAPTSIEQICALISLIRPGVLNSILPNGKSMAQSYVDRKAGIEPVQSLHKELDLALANTYNIILYQEQAMMIAAILAGFDLDEADKLRKAIGKKDAELMTKVEKMFLDGCKKTGKATEEEAKEIFAYLRESQRYSFNKSHGYGYGSIGYATAWVKCISPNTLVLTKDGYKNILELNIGDYILAPNYNNNTDEYVEVINKFDNGEKDLFKITTESGKEIECTIDHKLMCEDGKVRPLYEILSENYRIVCESD